MNSEQFFIPPKTHSVQMLHLSCLHTDLAKVPPSGFPRFDQRKRLLVYQWTVMMIMKSSRREALALGLNHSNNQDTLQ